MARMIVVFPRFTSCEVVGTNFEFVGRVVPTTLIREGEVHFRGIFLSHRAESLNHLFKFAPSLKLIHIKVFALVGGEPLVEEFGVFAEIDVLMLREAKATNTKSIYLIGTNESLNPLRKFVCL
jgi:hypothetical protein